jgi:hypothetical protein
MTSHVISLFEPTLLRNCCAGEALLRLQDDPDQEGCRQSAIR